MSTSKTVNADPSILYNDEMRILFILNVKIKMLEFCFQIVYSPFRMQELILRHKERETKMKNKIFIAVIVLMMSFILIFAGCAKTQDGVDSTNDNEDVQDADNGDTTDQIDEDSVDETDADADQADESSVPTDATPAASYQRYLDAKSAGYESISARMDASEGLAITASMEILAVSMIDLQVIDLVFVTDDTDASEAAANMMGLVDLSVQQSGEDFSVTYTGANSEKFATNGKYDAATDSISCTWTKDGQETLMLEYVKFGSGYAAQYYITDGQDTSVIKVIADREDIAIGMSGSKDRPASIYKSAPADFTFMDDCATVYMIVDGQGTSIVDGEQSEF